MLLARPDCIFNNSVQLLIEQWTDYCQNHFQTLYGVQVCLKGHVYKSESLFLMDSSEDMNEKRISDSQNIIVHTILRKHIFLSIDHDFTSCCYL